MSEQDPKAEKTEEAAAPAASEKKEAATPAQTLEAFFPEKHKDGDFYFKRRKGKPRYRMISVRKNQAKLFSLVRKEWQQKTAFPKPGKPAHGLDWHVRNKWMRIEKKDIPA